MTVTFRVDGLEEALAAFDTFDRDTQRELSRATRATAEKVRSDAIKSIQRGKKTGRVYQRGGGQNLSSTHQASAPGESPATDTGNLASSGKASGRGVSWQVDFTARYAHWLEFGTLDIEPRPFLVPAAEANVKFFEGKIRQALNKTARRFNK